MLNKKKIIGKISLSNSTNTKISNINNNNNLKNIINNITNSNNNITTKQPIRSKTTNNTKRYYSRKYPNINITSSQTHTNITNRSIYRSLSPKSRFFLPKTTKNKKKTLVLDLDETLVHSNFFPFTSRPSDVIIQIEIENEIHDIHVLVRPFVKEFLEHMSKFYEIIIFTASLSKYANPLLNQIDKKKVLDFRLFREHCTLINTAFVKDLTKLGRDLKDIIIVDNSPVAYALNQYNGFPIKSWFDDKNDSELLKSIPVLEFLSYVPDVRVYIKKIVKNNQIQFDKVSKVIKDYNQMLKKNKISEEINFLFGNFINENSNNNYNLSSKNFLRKSKSTKNNNNKIVITSKKNIYNNNNNNNNDVVNDVIIKKTHTGSVIVISKKKFKKKHLSINASNEFMKKNIFNMQTMRNNNNSKKKKLFNNNNNNKLKTGKSFQGININKLINENNNNNIINNINIIKNNNNNNINNNNNNKKNKRNKNHFNQIFKNNNFLSKSQRTFQSNVV